MKCTVYLHSKNSGVSNILIICRFSKQNDNNCQANWEINIYQLFLSVVLTLCIPHQVTSKTDEKINSLTCIPLCIYLLPFSFSHAYISPERLLFGFFIPDTCSLNLLTPSTCLHHHTQSHTSIAYLYVHIYLNGLGGRAFIKDWETDNGLREAGGRWTTEQSVKG